MRNEFFSTPSENLLARYFRVRISPPYRKIDHASGEGNQHPKLSLVNELIIKSNDPEKRVGKAGVCIYCGATEYIPGTGQRLSDEHIVARGLDGTLILDEASCRECAKQTGENTENFVLRGGMLAPRRQLHLRGRKRKRDEKDYDLVCEVAGKEVRLRFPLMEHPSILFIVGFNSPRAIGGTGGPSTFFIHTFNVPEYAIKQGAESIASHGFDTVRFSQMLAKIAHSYAVARIGLGKFKPYLPSFILRKFEQAEQYSECYEFVGGNPVTLAPAEPTELHQLGHEIMNYNGRRLLLIGIRLFASLAAPLFWVVAGEVHV